MNFRLRVGPRLVSRAILLLAVIVLCVSFLTARAAAQVAGSDAVEKAADPAGISKVRVLLDQGSPAIEITSTRPVNPNITKLSDPSRLVIDLPNSRMSVRHKRISTHSDEIGGVLMDRYATTPPAVRVEVSLLKPLSYTSTAAGNVLTIRLHAESAEVTAKPASVPALPALLAPKPLPVAVPVSTAGYGIGKVVLADRLASGASVSAGSNTTVLRLNRGGEIHVCPGTTVSVTHSPNGPDLMVGMSTGALETHYALENAADSILTPDFRILLRGPGEFHYAVSADARGNTCIRTLAGNTAPAFVSEIMGSGTFELDANDKIVLHNGHITPADTALHSGSGGSVVEVALPSDCGCPPPAPPVLLASASPEAAMPLSAHLAQPTDEAKPMVPKPDNSAASPAPMSAGLETRPLPPTEPNDVHVRIEAPIVYRAADEAKTAKRPKPAPVLEAKKLPLDYSAAPLPAVVLPPPQPAPSQASPSQSTAHSKPPRRGFFGRMKGFVSSIFR